MDNYFKILVNQAVAQKMRQSMYFSRYKRYYQENSDLENIIKALEYYGHINLFIVSNKDIGMITLNLLLPLKIKKF